MSRETDSNKQSTHRRRIAAAACLCMLIVCGSSFGGMSGHSSFLGGPWELVFKIGMEGDGYRFSIKVPDESKPHRFDSVLPIMGTAMKVRIDEYVPDLKWVSSAIKDPNGAALIELDLAGPNLKQNIWLSVDDPAKQSISASIGSIALRQLHNSKTAAKLIGELTKSKKVGVLTVWGKDGGEPQEYAIVAGSKIDLPGIGKQVEVVEYYSHYSIDSTTHEITNASPKAVNPAIKIRVVDGGKTSEAWLWSKFPHAPHKQDDLPLRARFADFDFGETGKGKYVLAVAGKSLWLLSAEDGKVKAVTAVLDKPYDFAIEGYSFTVLQAHDKAIFDKKWQNNSEKLMHPALVATISYEGVQEQLVLSLNKPSHTKTKLGTVVLFFRRNPGESEPDAG